MLVVEVCDLPEYFHIVGINFKIKNFAWFINQRILLISRLFESKSIWVILLNLDLATLLIKKNKIVRGCEYEALRDEKSCRKWPHRFTCFDIGKYLPGLNPSNRVVRKHWKLLGTNLVPPIFLFKHSLIKIKAKKLFFLVLTVHIWFNDYVITLK